MRNRMQMLRTCFAGVTLVMFMAIPCSGKSQDDLPDDFDQLIETKTGLLQQYSELSKSGAEQQAIDVLRKIVRIHRKALDVATETNKGQEIIGQLRQVYANDGEFLSDQLFAKAQFTDSAALRKDLEKLLSDVLGANHNATSVMHWKAVTAEKLSAASKEQQVAYLAAIGSKPQAVQAQKNGQADVAAQVYSKLIEAEVAVLGEVHTDVAADLNQLGLAQMSAGKTADAENIFSQSEIQRGRHRNDLQYASTSFNLGRLYQDTDRLKEAEKQYLAAAAIEEPILGSSHESFQQTLGQLAALYQQSGNTAKLKAVRDRIAAADPLNTVLAHLPRGTFAAAMLEPSAWSDDPGLSLLPFEIIRAAGEKELGLNPLDINAAVVFATLPIGDSPNFGVSFRVRDGVDAAFPWESGSEVVDFNGVQYLKEPSGGPNAICVKEFDDRVVVAGTEEAVRQCITNAAETPVTAMLKADRRKGQVVGAANLVVLRPILQAAIAQAPPAPPAIENLKSLTDRIDSAQIRLNVSGGVRLSLTLNAADEAAAQQTAAALTEALQFGSQMALQAMQAEMNGDDPMQVAGRSYVQRIATSYLDKLKPTAAENAVNIEIDAIDHAYGPVMVALLLPAVQAAREAAQRTQDSNSLKQISLAMHNYHEVHGEFPAQASVDKDGKPLLSWRVQLLPFLDEQALYEQFHLDEPWDSEHNLKLAEQMPAVFRSQTLGAANQTVFQSFVGSGAFLDGRKGLRMKDFTDGTSSTLMVAEVNADQAVVWTKPADVNFDEADPMKGLGSFRPQGFQAAFVDGSVRMISAEIKLETLRRLILRNDGEVIEEF
ncbi:MAG: DUF1559 domain-containing protein [Planctomycetaceae bacterium]